MKIGDSAGHTTSCPGASLYVNEVIEVRKILPIVNELLKPYHTIVSCQPPESYMYPQEINFRVQKSDNSGCDLYFSIHLNSSKKTDAPIGSEVLIYMGTQLTTKIGNKICSNLASLGFKNRGLKNGEGFAEISSVKCPSMIIEVFFVSSKADCDLYKKLGVEKIARAIANGIDDRISLNTPVKKPSKPTNKPSVKETYRVRKSWKDVDSQKGAYSVLNNAKTECDKHKGYSVFDSKGNIVYPMVEMHRNIIVYNDGAEADRICAEFFKMILDSKNEDCIVKSYKEYKEGKILGRSTFAVGGSLEGKFKYDRLFSGENRNLTAFSILQYLKTKY